MASFHQKSEHKNLTPNHPHMYNSITYIIYITIMVYITVVVGKVFHKNGYHFIMDIWKNNELTISVNNILLVGYYCFNIGYVLYILHYWEHVNSIDQCIQSLGSHCGKIIIALGVMHYINMTSIYLIRWFQINTINTNQ
ncbi:MAG: hypothetical protein ACI9N1_001152 [Flavobacteriales bacterium]